MSLNGSYTSICTATSMSANRRLCTEDSRKLTNAKGFHTKDDDHKSALGEETSIKTGLALLAYVLQKCCQNLIPALYPRTQKSHKSCCLVKRLVIYHQLSLSKSVLPWSESVVTDCAVIDGCLNFPEDLVQKHTKLLGFARPISY